MRQGPSQYRSLGLSQRRQRLLLLRAARKRFNERLWRQRPSGSQTGRKPVLAWALLEWLEPRAILSKQVGACSDSRRSLIKPLALFIFALSFLTTGCRLNDNRIKGTIGSPPEVTPPPCVEGLNTEPCLTVANQYVTGSNGSSVNGNDGELSFAIPDGYYAGMTCSASDTDLVAANIVNGVSIFGVTGTASGPFPGCTDEALNNSQCSTQANRYVYTSSYGGRSATCSVGLNAAACWTNSTNQYMTSTAGGNVNGAEGSLSATIPAGYYSGAQTATMSDADLLATNIRSGTTIFGTLGTLLADTSKSNAHRDLGSTQLSQNQEVTTHAGSGGTPELPANYRAVPDILKDDEGDSGTNVTKVNRTAPLNWDTGCSGSPCTCGASGSIEDRINDCATVIGAEASWDGAVKGNAGQGVWKLVSRTGSPASGMGKEVWKDMRTGLLWSSKVSTSLNWCKASGSNEILNNPFAADDPSNYCDHDQITPEQYQNEDDGDLAISACYEDGENYFTTSDAGINNNGKAGLGYPSVRWRLPTIFDYKHADINGLRFVLPDADVSWEWSSSVLSTNRNNAWIFGGSSGLVVTNLRTSNQDVRCVGR